MQRQQEISGPPETSAQDSIHFEDALGRTEALPYVYFRSWQVSSTTYVVLEYRGLTMSADFRSVFADEI